jgi:uncharacterized protein
MITRNRIFIILGLLVVAGIFMTGCTQQAAPVQAPATTQATPVATPATNSAAAPAEQTNIAVKPSMANPASVNCGTIGGSTEIRKDADGNEYGMCSFPNGTSCEEWALFRGEGCKTNVTASNTTAAPAGMANPASVNCGKIGGSTEIRKNADGGEYGMCAFPNGTSCEEWALYRGEGCTANATAPAK